MQGWLFYNAAGFWKNPQVEAFLTAVPKVDWFILCFEFFLLICRFQLP